MKYCVQYIPANGENIIKHFFANYCKAFDWIEYICRPSRAARIKPETVKLLAVTDDGNEIDLTRKKYQIQA